MSYRSRGIGGQTMFTVIAFTVIVYSAIHDTVDPALDLVWATQDQIGIKLTITSCK